jgi:hypothetical protein
MPRNGCNLKSGKCHRPQPAGLKMRCVDGGLFISAEAGRIGRGEKLPPQFGQTPLSRLSTQSRQNVHSNVQIIASVADGGRFLSQHSQLGRRASMGHLRPADRAGKLLGP